MTEVDVEITPYREHVDLISVAGKEIYLVATAHVSRASVDLVDQVIDDVRPDAVAIELCESRYKSVMDPDRWRNTDVYSAVRDGRGYVLLAQLFLAAFQKKIGDKLDVKPGAEMIRASEAARRVGAEILLADRDVKITLRRVWGAMGLKTAWRVMSSVAEGIAKPQKLTAEEVERLKSSDALESILREFSEAFPEVREALISERDRYMAGKLRGAPARRVVAVIGAGHTPGIRREIGRPQDLSALERIPRKSVLRLVIGWAVPLLVLFLIVRAAAGAGGPGGAEAAKTWVVATVAGSVLGAVLAAAHPLTVLASGVVAPFAAANPFFRVGWVAALVEAVVRRPRVSDLETFTDDLLSVKAWYRNRARKVLLVLVLVNLAGLAGALVGAAVLGAGW